MVYLGEYNELEVVKEVDFGIYLDGGEEFGEILLPSRYVPEGIQPGDTIHVFLYTDSEDRVIATTEEPKAVAGEFALLQVVSVSAHGAFLDWGLPKDLLLPMGEQKWRVKPGDFCVVRVYLHERTGRVAASQKLNKFLEKNGEGFKTGEQVSLLIVDETDLGYSAVVNGTHWGLIFENDIFEPLQPGDRRTGFIKQVREDGKIDLTLSPAGYRKIKSFAEELLACLEAAGGFLALTDKTAPDIIYRELKMSKKNFKKTVGALYRERLILIEEDGIRLAEI